MPLDAPSFPVSLVVAGRPCLVVGGGRVAARKVDALVRSEADVTVVAPEVDDAIVRAAVSVERRAYEPGEAARYRLVITATGVAAVDRQVFADAEAAGVFVNAADDPEACTFVLPAVLRRGAVSVAVSTDGTSPALATLVRDRIAALVGPEYGELATRIGRVRGGGARQRPLERGARVARARRGDTRGPWSRGRPGGDRLAGGQLAGGPGRRRHRALAHELSPRGVT